MSDKTERKSSAYLLDLGHLYALLLHVNHDLVDRFRGDDQLRLEISKLDLHVGDLFECGMGV